MTTAATVAGRESVTMIGVGMVFCATVPTRMKLGGPKPTSTGGPNIGSLTSRGSSLELPLRSSRMPVSVVNFSPMTGNGVTRYKKSFTRSMPSTTNSLVGLASPVPGAGFTSVTVTFDKLTITPSSALALAPPVARSAAVSGTPALISVIGAGAASPDDSPRR